MPEEKTVPPVKGICQSERAKVGVGEEALSELAGDKQALCLG